MPQTASKPKQTPQPLEVANNPHALLNVSTVMALLGLSRSTLYRMVAEKRFVDPIHLSSRCTRFRAGEVTAWMASK